ncbi:MAG: hypothetical protein N2Z21_10015 [Candidatus Sumerlaeaceae bacterium]|nr:hypothetical protein [Candidatus Sumerlaeaceae bacterium]
MMGMFFYAGAFASKEIAPPTTTSGLKLKPTVASRPKQAAKRVQKELTPDLWLTGQALALNRLPSVKVYPGTQAQTLLSEGSRSVEFVILGRHLEDFGAILTRDISQDNLQEFVACDRDGKPLFDDRSGALFLLPSAKLIQATMRRGTELLTSGAQGLILWLPHLPVTDTSLAQIGQSEDEYQISPVFYQDSVLSPPLVVWSSLERSVVAIDRTVAGIRDIQTRNALQEGSIWLASYSWADVVASGLAVPLLSLPRNIAVDGLLAVVVPLPLAKLDRSLKTLNVTEFEWTYFQAATSAAVAERLNCPLILTCPYEFLSPGRLFDIAVAAHLTSPRRSKLLLGWDSGTVESPEGGKGQKAGGNMLLCPSVVSIVAQCMAFEKATRTRWESGSRSVAIGISDGAQLIANGEKAVTEILSLWLPCMRAGLPARFVAFDALADLQAAAGANILLSSFSFQIPQNDEIVALSEWIKRGGTFVLLDDQTSTRPILAKADDTFATGIALTTATAAMRLFHELGLPVTVTEGAYRVGDGWLFYFSRSQRDWALDQGERVLLGILQRVAETTRKTLVMRPQCTVYCGATVAGYVASRGPESMFQLRGNFIDLTTTSLELVRFPVYRRGQRFLLRSLPMGTPDQEVDLLAANIPVTPSQRGGARLFSLPNTYLDCMSDTRKLWIRRPSVPFRIVDVGTGETLDYEIPSMIRAIAPKLCSETTSLEVTAVP